MRIARDDGAGLPEMALDDAGRESPEARRRRSRGFRQAQNLERPRAVGQAADEAAFLERHDQAVDAGFRPQVERVLHFVEGGRNAGLFQALMNITEQFALLFGQHVCALSALVFAGPTSAPTGAAFRGKNHLKTNHERTIYVRAWFRKRRVEIQLTRSAAQTRKRPTSGRPEKCGRSQKTEANPQKTAGGFSLGDSSTVEQRTSDSVNLGSNPGLPASKINKLNRR